MRQPLLGRIVLVEVLVRYIISTIVHIGGIGGRMMNLKEHIRQDIVDFVRDYGQEQGIVDVWRTPLVGFADARCDGIKRLKELVSPEHVMPWEVLEDATIIIAYFVPFSKALGETNACTGLASPQWALAYEQTNAMFNALNDNLIHKLRLAGYHAAVSPEATTFDRDKLISHWSQRHIAYLAGLGSFGINNMLITKEGCCGRYSTIVTNLPVVADHPIKTDYCLYKKNGTCGVCTRHCSSGALTCDGYDRKKCFAVLLKNAEVYTDFGSSYTNEDGTGSNSTGSEVCGKCVVHIPCATCAPGVKIR